MREFRHLVPLAAKNEDNADKDKVTITRYIYVGSDCVLEKVDDYGKHCILRRSQSAGSNGKIVNVQRVAFQNAFQTFKGNPQSTLA